jgi:NADPH-dependent 7-cyano-7-deazaguanine reductase QueF-like protein
VEAWATGPTKLDALNQAWNDAVRQGLGMFVMSKTQVIYDELTEQIVALAKGRINSYEELFSEKNGDTWRVTIRAIIDRDLLEESAQKVRVKIVELDTQTLGDAARQRLAKASNAEEKLAAKRQLVSLFFENHDLYGFYELSNIVTNVENNILIGKVRLRFNKKFLNQFVNEFIELLDQVAISKEFYKFDNNTIIANEQFLNKQPRKGIIYLINAIDLKPCSGFTITLPISASSYIGYCIDKNLKNEFYTPINSYIYTMDYDKFDLQVHIFFKVRNNLQIIAIKSMKLQISNIFSCSNPLEFRPYMHFHGIRNDELFVQGSYDLSQFNNFVENSLNNDIKMEASLIFSKH